LTEDGRNGRILFDDRPLSYEHMEPFSRASI